MIYPCPTLRVQPHDCPRMARGQDGSLRSREFFERFLLTSSRASYIIPDHGLPIESATDPAGRWQPPVLFDLSCPPRPGAGVGEGRGDRVGGRGQAHPDHSASALGATTGSEVA